MRKRSKGLGLYIARELVEYHGGKLYMDTIGEETAGRTLCLNCRGGQAVIDQPMAGGREYQRCALAVANEHGKQPKTILVIDDELFQLRRIMSTMLPLTL